MTKLLLAWWFFTSGHMTGAATVGPFPTWAACETMRKKVEKEHYVLGYFTDCWNDAKPGDQTEREGGK